MRTHSLARPAAQLSILLMLAAAVAPAAPREKGPGEKAPFPKRSVPAQGSTAQGPPDLSGVWFVREYARNILPKEDPPFQPWAEAAFKARDLENMRSDPDGGPDPTSRCIPPGIPRTMLQPFPWEIVQARDRVVIVFEYQSLVRQIFVDGRGHPADLDPTYMGHATGKYEGDTLVVDTIGFNDQSWLDPKGLPHTDALRVTERIRRVDHDTLEDTITIDDAKAYTRPWTAHKVYKLKPDWQIHEYVCAENNRVR